MNGPREELIELLTAHFDRTRGISDDSAEEAREIADLIMASKWPYRQGDLTGTDVADRLGVGLSTINGWRKRYADSSDPFPQPDESAHSRATLAGSPLAQHSSVVSTALNEKRPRAR